MHVSGRTGRACAAVSLAAILGGGVPPVLAADPVGAPAAGPVALEVRDDRLTGRLEAVPVETVLEALAGATGAGVRGRPSAPREVTADFEAMPLALALPRIVGEQSFTLEYGRDGRLTAIVLRGGPEAPSPAAPARPAADPAASPAGPRPFPLVLGRAFTRHRPVELPAPRAQALGSERTTFVQLLETAASDDDGVRRAQATQVVLSALERESRLRRAFLRSLYALDADDLATLAAGETGARFQGLLAYLAAHSREPALQKKAAVFLQQLRQPAADEPAS